MLSAPSLVSSLTLLSWVLILANHVEGSNLQEVCDRETFQATCGQSEVVLMTEARYGRFRVGRCVPVDLGYLGCSAGVLQEVDALCSGRQSCSLNVSPEILDITGRNSCPEGLVFHMEASYMCVKVIEPNNGECGLPEGFQLHQGHGVISSHVTDDIGCGSITSPWVISVTPGQRVKFTMTDFGWTLEEDEMASDQNCVTYGFISEKSLGINRTVCGSLQKTHHVYSSQSGNVEVQILAAKQRQNEAKFLLHYEVTGCPDISPPSHAWYKRDGDAAVIGCEWSEHSWHLTCEGSTWVGVVGNCSKPDTVSPPPEKELLSISPVLTMGIIAGLGVLVVVLVCTICIGYCCFRKKKPQEPSVAGGELPYSGEGQSFLYYPGRPTPLNGPYPQETGVTAGGAKPNMADELLHIWETPLPDPGGNPQDDSGYNASQGTYATLPCRGTMVGPCPPQDSQVRVAAGDGGKPSEGTWPGTRAFFDQEKGVIMEPCHQ